MKENKKHDAGYTNDAPSLDDHFAGKYAEPHVTISVTLPPLNGDYSAGAVVEVDVPVKELLAVLSGRKRWFLQ